MHVYMVLVDDLVAEDRKYYYPIHFRDGSWYSYIIFNLSFSCESLLLSYFIIHFRIFLLSMNFLYTWKKIFYFKILNR